MILLLIFFIVITTTILLLICFRDNFIDNKHINYFKERNPNKLKSKIERNPNKLKSKIERISSKYKNIKIYIVNLEKHSDRKLHMINLMNNFGFKNYEFITPISLDYIKNNKQFKNWKMSDSKISHVLTFLKIFEKSSDELFFIMEDDIDAYSDISINKILDNSIKYTFDMLYLEMCYINCDKTKLIDNDIYLINKPSCAACILYNKNFTDKILNIYNNSKFDYITKYEDIDVVYNKLQSFFNFVYIGFPYFRQNPKFGSSLQGSMRYNNKNNEFDKICN